MMKTRTQGFFGTIKEIVLLLCIVFLIRTVGFGLYQVPTGSMETTMLVGERFFADKLTLYFTQPQRGEIVAFNDPSFEYAKNNGLKKWFQQYVWGPTNWTKRVIAIPGDVIKGVIEDNKPVIYLNNKKLDEPYVNQLPLITMWKMDPEKLRSMSEHEIIARCHRGELCDRKSYDPNLSYNQQSHYRIEKQRVYIDGATGQPELEKSGRPTSRDTFEYTLGENQYWCMGDNRMNSHDCRAFGPLDGSLIHGRIKFRIWSIDSDESWWILDLIKNPVDFWGRVRWNRFFQRVV